MDWFETKEEFGKYIKTNKRAIWRRIRRPHGHDEGDVLEWGRWYEEDDGLKLGVRPGEKRNEKEVFFMKI